MTADSARSPRPGDDAPDDEGRRTPADPSDPADTDARAAIGAGLAGAEGSALDDDDTLAPPDDVPLPGTSARGAPSPASVPPTTAEAEAVHGRHHPGAKPSGRRLAALSLMALGVVYGDIGTSPLYAMKEAFHGSYGLQPIVSNVYGVLSLILWSLLLVVTVKYVGFILRADNRGEGGVFALLALVLQRRHRSAESKRRAALIALGLLGGAFLYGDGIITPAISVLGAVEGLQVSAPALGRFVVPIAFGIIAVLFFFQSKGTAKVGGAFGWIMLVWFVTIATLGIREIALEPQILAAVNPWYAVQFFLDHPLRSFVVLGAVVLVITGGEALYADMGHFGRRPIRIVWFGFVLPALLLNYFGQGALLLRDPAAVENPFYLLAPGAFQIPLLVIATLAAIVASQALISGAFSLTQQAVQLGYSPRMTIVHTSSREMGQIYVPEVNKLLAAGTLLLVVGFGSSTALGAAYGVAVTATMAITTLLFHDVTRHQWHWPAWRSWAFTGFFLAVDLAFFAANALKIPKGGWVPIAVAIGAYTLMSTWKRGRLLLAGILNRAMLPLDLFLESVRQRKPVRVPGTAIFMTSESAGAPVVLLHHLKHNKVLHEQVVLLSIKSVEVPEVRPEHRVHIERCDEGIFRVIARYGFMESPDVQEILLYLADEEIEMRETSFYLGRERLIPTGTGPLARWRKKLFVVMSRNARTATEYFNIPPNRVVELGTQIEF
ncbi:MAG TPA: potassium transporter Kup [Gemmatimonadaceae bacterium]